MINLLVTLLLAVGICIAGAFAMAFGFYLAEEAMDSFNAWRYRS